MNCNEEEAIRAKEIAIKKMESNDFAGAHKIAHKAQRLYAHIENISQMMCVCKVHCSAEDKSMGNEKDWYGILQVSQSADDVLIKKQYHKLALLLHPDKNKFAGAEAAFKLIAEAQKMLLDKDRRSSYDLKRRTFTRPIPPNRPSAQGNMNLSAVRPQETFWTHCPFCSVQHYKDVVNRALGCQSCNKPFIAYDLNAQGMPPGPSSNRNSIYPQARVHRHNVAPNSLNSNGCSSNFHQQKPKMNSFPNTDRDADVKGMHKPSVSPKNTKRNSKGKVPDWSNSSKKTNRKRGKKQESSESSASESVRDSEEAAKDACMASGIKVEQKSNCRHSSRNKKHVAYDESGSDKEEMGCPSKRTKMDGLFSSTEEGTGHASSKEELCKKTNYAEVDEKVDKRTDKMNDAASMENIDRSFLFLEKETLDASSKEELGRTCRRPSLDDKYKSRTDKLNGDASVANTSTTAYNLSAENSSSDASDEETILHEFPDPDFSDFDGVRNIDRFQVGQIWAIYDTVDAMPRFYAQIRKVFSVGFKLKITWFEPDPVSEDEKQWVKKELPVSCGKYKHGNTENTEYRLMFSHPITWEKGSNKGAFKIYPKKDEIWALFKDWHIGWISDPDNSRKYEFLFVEVLSNYDDTRGVRIACLGKLKGFTSLFCRLGGDEIQIPPSEYLRFSHRVLSFTMSGTERDDVPRGSFELDPSCISPNLEEITIPPQMGAEDHLSNGPSSEYVHVDSNGKVQGKASPPRHHDCTLDVDVDEHAKTPKLEPEDANKIPDEIPNVEFFNFEATKAMDKFQIGQVRDLCSDVDGLPKLYACIKKDDISHVKLRESWSEACSLPSDLIRWKDLEIPISCRTFKKKRRNFAYSDAGVFSHLVAPEAIVDKNEETQLICPKENEETQLICPKENEETQLICPKENEETQLICSKENEETQLTCEYEYEEKVRDDQALAGEGVKPHSPGHQNSLRSNSAGLPASDNVSCSPGTAKRRFASVRVGSKRASGLAARNKMAFKVSGDDYDDCVSSGVKSFERSDKDDEENKAQVDCPTARRHLMEDLDIYENDHNNCTELSGFSYVDSQEPGECSLVNALAFVEQFLNVSVLEYDQDAKHGNPSEKKPDPAFSGRGAQSLAKKVNHKLSREALKIYDWYDELEDEGGCDFFCKMGRFGTSSRTLKSYTEPKKKPKHQHKVERKAADPDKLRYEELHPVNVDNKMIDVVLSEPNQSKTSFREVYHGGVLNVRRNLNPDMEDMQLCEEPAIQHVETEAVNDEMLYTLGVGIDTQMAAEAIEALSNEPHFSQEVTPQNEGCLGKKLKKGAKGSTLEQHSTHKISHSTGSGVALRPKRSGRGNDPLVQGSRFSVVSKMRSKEAVHIVKDNTSGREQNMGNGRKVRAQNRNLDDNDSVLFRMPCIGERENTYSPIAWRTRKKSMVITKDNGKDVTLDKQIRNTCRRNHGSIPAGENHSELGTGAHVLHIGRNSSIREHLETKSDQARRSRKRLFNC